MSQTLRPYGETPTIESSGDSYKEVDPGIAESTEPSPEGVNVPIGANPQHGDVGGASDGIPPDAVTEGSRVDSHVGQVALDGYGIQDPGGNLDEPPLNDVSQSGVTEILPPEAVTEGPRVDSSVEQVALDGYGIQDPGGNLDEPPPNDVSKLKTADDSPDSSANTDLIGGAPDDSLTGPTDDAENDWDPGNDDSTGGAGADPNEEVTAAEPDIPDLQDSDKDLIPLEDGQTVRLQEYEVTNSDHPRNHPESDDSNDDPTGSGTSEADQPIRDGERGPEESVSEDDATEQIAHNQDVLLTSDEDIAAFLSETSSNDEDASAVSEGLSKNKTESVLEVTDPQLITDESMGNDHTIGQTEDPSVDNHATVESSDRVPTNDAQVERAWGISEQVDAGRSFMPAGDDMHEPAERIKPSLDEYTVFIHGNTHEVGIEHPNGDWQFLDAEGLADVIRSDPDWNGETVRLFSCDTGKEPDDGSPVFAQDLANELGSDVVAPSEKGFYFNGVDWVSSSREVTDPLTREVRHLPNSPPSNPDGRWEIFHPTPQGRTEQ